MFPRKKPLPSFQLGYGDTSKSPDQELPFHDRSGPSSATNPTSPSEYPYGVPTLQPSSTDTSTSSLKPQRNSQHSRSASHPFPAIFGGIGIKRDGNKAEKERAGHQGYGKSLQETKGVFSSSLPKMSSRPSASEVDLITGRCATCDAIVRWPRNIETFRCSVCHMINDLQYGSVKDVTNGLGSLNTSSTAVLPKRAAPISLDRIRSQVNQCTYAYLRHKVNQGLNRQSEPDRLVENSKPNQQDERIAREARWQANIQQRHAESLAIPTLKPRSVSNHRRHIRSPNRVNDQAQQPHDGSSRPRTAPGQPRPSLDGSDETEPRYIYRQLENSLATSMSNCDSLNMSFAIFRPSGPVREPSEANIHEQSRQQELSEGLDGFLSEVDAKMLLMGDIGENARFWTGNRMETIDGHKPAPTFSQSTPDRKPPRFHWRQVSQWYSYLLSCGRLWRMMRSSFKGEDKLFLEDPTVEKEIDSAFAEARHHVQRTLLKLTERLLIHPGRPVKRAEDARFLFILLCNPLLQSHQTHPVAEGHTGATRSVKISTLEQQLTISPLARSEAEAASRANASGHHSGVIKRILGILGNLPQGTHHDLISWLSRMPAPQFKDLVELVSGFVSYRLSRNAGRTSTANHDPTNGLIPVLGGSSSGSMAQLHAAVATAADSSNPSAHQTSKTRTAAKYKENSYADDWQVKTAARFMSLLFFANFGSGRLRQNSGEDVQGNDESHFADQYFRPGQLLPVSAFYNVLLDSADLVKDFEQWEQKREKFSFCQYPMFLSIWAKIRLMGYDAKRQMKTEARNAFFDTIMKGKTTKQHFILHVRRDCVVEDSLNEISHVVGSDEIKKGLKIEFEGEEGVDVGGLRKEWFLLLVREVFDPRNGLFLYDDDSKFCYFNPHTFETSDQFYLIGVLLGLAIYNSTILDITLPPFLFRKLLAAAPSWAGPGMSTPRPQMTYTIDDLAEWRPELARGLRQLLEYDGDVETTFCRDFVVDVDRYGTVIQVPLCENGHQRPVTNANRKEFVNLYVRYILDTSVSRQFEPFKRGFFTVCSGNALGLFRPEEIELLVRGSDEPLDVESLQGVAVYDGWGEKPEQIRQIQWFWQTFKEAEPSNQRRLLGFVTGSDRIPAMGATSLVIKIGNLGEDSRRFPIARTCFNMIALYYYESKAQLEYKLWTAVDWSEGFALK